MTYCVYCITEIEPDNPKAVGCADDEHFAHNECHEPMRVMSDWACPACADPTTFASEVENAIAGGMGGYGIADPDAGLPMGALDASATAVADSSVVTAVADPSNAAPVVDPSTAPVDPSTAAPVVDPSAAAAVADPTADLAGRYGTGAARLTAAIQAAQAALEAAEATITSLTDAGLARTEVVGALTTIEPHYQAALDACARYTDYLAWGDVASWDPAEETLRDMDVASVSFEGYAPRLAGVQAVLAAMRAVDVGDTAYLSNATARHNVADAALTGEGYRGTNSHPLSGDLKGWISIREEGGNVILIRWAGDRWQIGATGEHTSKKGSGGFDYKLDNGISTDFKTTLAWQPTGGRPTLV
jgi:hypothetical protein